MSHENPSRPCYHLSIAVAGSALGGVYSAGVLDFLLEALREIERSVNSGEIERPKWDVHLTDFVGTSSGGVTAALAFSMLPLDYEPLRADFNPDLHKPPRNNTLYDFWVKRAVPEVFLGIEDLQSKSKEENIGKESNGCFCIKKKNKVRAENEITDTKPIIRSVFAADAMYTISKDSLKSQILLENGRETYAVPKYSENIRLTLTHTNLKGVTYVERKTEIRDHPMTVRTHADYTTFDTNRESKKDDAYYLDMNASRSEEQWLRVVDAMAATSAFPLILAPKMIKNKKSFYESRYPVVPEWQNETENEQAFYAIDGFLNTKPYDLAERGLKNVNGSNDARKIESNPKSAWGSILLVDAFPPDPLEKFRNQESPGLFDTAISTWTATRAQAGFKHDLMTRAMDEKDLSTFLIAPIKGEPDLSSKRMFNSASILHEKMRLYDFMRGRYDAQRFLRDSFVLSASDAAENPIFQTGSEISVPIIPLVGSASIECIIPERPLVPRDALYAIQKSSKQRIDKLVNVAAQELGLIQPAYWWNLGKISRNLFMKAALAAVRKVVSNKFNNAIEDEVEEFLERNPKRRGLKAKT